MQERKRCFEDPALMYPYLQGESLEDFAVKNPMHIITLKAKKTSLGVRIAGKIKSISEQWFSHVLLLAILSGYALIGALIFYWLEKGPDDDKLEQDDRMKPVRDSLLDDLQEYIEDLSPKQNWREKVEQRIKLYEENLMKNCEDKVQWTVWSALFYCGTVMTTIGYGNIAPSTDAGKAATIVYAFLGIPLMLMVLADLGKLFTKANKFIFRYVLRFYKSGTCSKSKAADLANSKKPLQYMTVSWRTVSRDLNSDPRKDGNSNCNQVTTLTLHNDDLYKDLDFMNADEANHKHVAVEDEFNLPVSLAIALVLVYMVIGAFLFAVWEEWTFFESFYFVFISMSTVGFGDYVPSNQTYMMGAFAYLVLGLTLTSMCINVIQEKLSATFQKAKVRIGNTIGLDVNTLLSDEARRSRSPKSDQTSLRNVKYYGSKVSLQKDALPSRPSTPVSDPSQRPVSTNDLNNPKCEILLNVPSQKRFTFYDSPYSTIQNDSLYNTVHSIT